MTPFTAALRLRLIADAGVGAHVTRRIHWTMVPAKTDLPYIRLQVISDPRPQHLDDYDGARISRVQCDCFADTYDQARAIAEAVIAAVAHPAEVAGTAFGRTKAEGPRDLGADSESEADFIFTASVDLLAEHRRA